LTKQRLELGKLGEDLAFKKIKQIGYKKIIRNYSCSLGEIDMIAMDGATLVFIEIKTRKNRSTAYAKEAITERKKKQISKVALAYINKNECHGIPARFDVVAISLKDDKTKIEVIKNAFELAYGDTS
jgi:putative endonuclease